jgi:type II secretory pathway pseudopilin PulG
MGKVPRNKHKQGFSLIQVSVLVAVAGIILASTLPGGELGSAVERDRITREKMEKIEAATQNFMAANLRRPCPADGTLAIGSANFGVEDTTSGRCSNANFWTQYTPFTKTGATTTSTSAVATTLSNTTGLAIGMLVTGTNIATDTHIASIDSATQITLDKYPTGASGTLTFTSLAAGVVPTKTLGLPDDYMFDGYGRRMMYMVDIRATDKTTCRNIQTTKTKGAIEIMTARSAISIFTDDNVMWSLISYGKNGHGAFPMQGSSLANRVDAGATSGDERYNAFVDINTTNFNTMFTQYIVRREPITTVGNSYIDDIVWTHESTKNTCCVGKMCNAGTRIDGAALETLGWGIKTGDINGDGIYDMIIYSPWINTIRVVFGSSTGWSPNSGMAMGTANSKRFFTITNNSSHPNFLYNGDSGASIAVGDINGDGYDDITFGYGDGTDSAIKVFYGSATPVDTNTSAITNIITFPATTGAAGPSIVLGKFVNTTKKDILALITTASGTGNSTAYVIYGASSYSLTAEAVTTVAATVGFKINTTSPGRLETVSTISNGVGDINNDGYDEILISNYTNNNLYVLFGQSAANWDTDKTTAATGSTPDIVNIDTRVTAGVTEAVKFTNGGTNIGRYTIAVADVDNDGTYKDIFFNNGNYFYVYYGKTAASWTSPNLSTASNYDGTNGFRIDVVTTNPSWLTDPMTFAHVADVNGDGKTDLIFTEWAAGPNSVATSGSNFITLQPSGGWSSIWTGGTLTLFGQVFDATGTGLPLNNDVSKGFRIDGYTSSDGINIHAIVDINNDGKNDLIISSNHAFSDAGAVYILFGRTLVPWDTSTNVNILN